MATAQVWVQEQVRDGQFHLYKAPGEYNPADILTKAVDANLIDRHATTAGLSWEPGRPRTAPLLDGFAWESAMTALTDD